MRWTRRHGQLRSESELSKLGLSRKDSARGKHEVWRVSYPQQLPKPWGYGAEQELFEDALEQAALADRLGIDYIWALEHHFLEEFSHASAPDLFLAATSQRTHRVRLGHGVAPLAGDFHPARMAERISTLDLLANGRVDFAAVASSRFGLEGLSAASMADADDGWAGLAQSVDMMTTDTHAGTRSPGWSGAARNVLPKPVQKPHPPMWLVCSEEAHVRKAATMGVGALVVMWPNVDAIRRWVGLYYQTLQADCEPIGHAVNANVAAMTGLSVHRDAQQAIDRGLEGWRFFEFARSCYRAGAQPAKGGELWQRFVEVRGDLIGAEEKASNDSPSAAERRGAIGSPGQVRAFLRRLADTGLDQVVFVQQAGRARHDHICDSMRLFAERVMPEFHSGERERVNDKLRGLASFVDAAFARKTAEPTLVAEGAVAHEA